MEAWVIALGALAQVTIAVPMISLWNPSVSKSASFVTTFAVFCVGGMVGNAIVMFTSIISFSQDLAFLVGSGNVVFALALCGGEKP